MSIYKTLLESAERGGRFEIGLGKKDLWIGRKQYVRKGEVIDEDELINKDDLEIDVSDSWEVIKYLYQKYKHSIPNSRWKDKSYFKALTVEELTDAEMAFNDDRNYAQAMLEGYILLAGLSGWIKWPNDEHWFWQSDEDEDLIVMREWI